MGSSITAAVVEESGLSDQTECLRTESGTGRAYAHGTRTGRLRQVVDVPGEYPLLWSTTNACSGSTAPIFLPSPRRRCAGFSSTVRGAPARSAAQMPSTSRSLLVAHDRAETFLGAPAIDLAGRELAGRRRRRPGGARSTDRSDVLSLLHRGEAGRRRYGDRLHSRGRAAAALCRAEVPVAGP